MDDSRNHKKTSSRSCHPEPAQVAKDPLNGAHEIWGWLRNHPSPRILLR